MGVIFFVMNAAFALVLLILVLVSSMYAFVSKNPDVRYQPMRDDRGSFIKSHSHMSTELDALGATARGDMKGRDLDDDRDSFTATNQAPLAPSTANSGFNASQYEIPRSPVDNSVPFFPASGGDGRQGSPYTGGQQTGGFGGMLTPGAGRTPSRGGGSPTPSSYSGNQQDQTQMYPPQQQARGQNQWQVGAGYSH